MDFLLLNLYLGAVVFFAGMIVLLRITREVIKNKFKITLLVILHFIASFIISLIIWHCWFFDFDIMFGFISLPAIIAEIITTSIVYLIIIKGKNLK